MAVVTDLFVIVIIATVVAFITLVTHPIVHDFHCTMFTEITCLIDRDAGIALLLFFCNTLFTLI